MMIGGRTMVDLRSSAEAIAVRSAIFAERSARSLCGASQARLGEPYRK